MMIMFVLVEYINSTLFLCYIFCSWEKLPSHACMAGGEMCLGSPQLYLLSPKHFRLFVFIKNY